MPRFSFICCHIARALPPNRRNMGNTTRDNTRKTFRVYSEHSENTKITLREHLRSVPSCAGCHLIENKLILIYTISQLKYLWWFGGSQELLNHLLLSVNYPHSSSLVSLLLPLHYCLILEFGPKKRWEYPWQWRLTVICNLKSEICGIAFASLVTVSPRMQNNSCWSFAQQLKHELLGVTSAKQLLYLGSAPHAPFL